ncbi:hypothetical protein C8Q80DRAFT_1130856 [Daedaleopsis nitida]|nr:hypothetical protein C8Q80DRAFT_1130856 [Daedaleopsis nitida]
MPPNYDLQTYWQTRFGREEHFEWLGDGSDTILPHIGTYLLDPRTSARVSPSQPPRLLHIGAGTSSLSKQIGQLYQEVYGADVDKSAIVHTDFAENLVARMQQSGQKAHMGGSGGDGGMRWICVDILNWADLKTALDVDGDECAYDLVVDKSTSDAIACGGDISYNSPDLSLPPAFQEQLMPIDVAPMEVLAVHLASLDAEVSQTGRRYATAYWELERVVEVDAPSGMEGRGHAPAIQHYVFLLRRRRD